MKISETKNWFFKKNNKIGKPLARHTKNRREKAKINNFRNKIGNIIENLTDIKRIINEYYEQLTLGT